MKRLVAFIATIAITSVPCSSRADPFVAYVFGGATMTGERFSPSIRSGADATAYNSRGEILWNQALQGFHNIHLEDSPTMIVAGESLWGLGSISSFVHGDGEVFRCYNARINMRAIGFYGQGRYLDFTSLEYCVPESACQDFTACSPILLDLEQDGFHLVGAESGVSFDIDADSEPELVSWTESGDAFLCLDRDGDGSIGSGAELFGNVTPTEEGGPAENGFHALAGFDTSASGGNEDGRISTMCRHV